MLNRQKLLLHMIEKAGRPVLHLELTKWAFLLAREMPSRGGPSFYQFLPYKYGPFSFCLYREVGRLAHGGYLAETNGNGRGAWRIVEDAERPTGDLRPALKEDAARVVERFKDWSADAVLNYVYDRFPWFTVNSTTRKSQVRPVARPAVFTVGYEGCSIDQLLNVLMWKGIHRVIDVRRNPVARRYGFHKSSLARICSKVHIDYVHVPQVGIPSELRRDLDGPAAHARLLEKYEKKILPPASAAVARIARMVSDKPTALMCMEADPGMCHRTRLANAVSSVTHLPVHHIGGKTCNPVLS